VDTVVAPLIGQTEDLLKIYELKRLDQALKALILFKITHPDDQGESNALQRKRPPAFVKSNSLKDEHQEIEVPFLRERHR
jgi:hypothetical protein